MATVRSKDLPLSEFYTSNRRKYRVIFFTADLDMSPEYEAFIQIALTVQQLGHEAIFVTCICEPFLIQNQLKTIRVFEIGRCLPQSFFTGSPQRCHMMRTCFTALWIANRRCQLRPTFVIVQNANSALSLLKLIANVPVVYYQSNNELNSLNEIEKQDERDKKYHENCLEFTSEIIVQTKITQKYFNQIFTNIQSPTVIYPCVETLAFDTCPPLDIRQIVSVPENAIVFVTFGALNLKSFFELSIHAFALLLDECRHTNPEAFTNLYLIIVYQCLDDNYNNKQYLEYLYQFAISCSYHRPSIIFVQGGYLAQRKALMKGAEAVLHPMISTNGNIIMEAGLLNKPVLTVNYGLSAELVVHNENGYILEPNVLSFYECMSGLIYYKEGAKERTRKIFNFVQKNFSRMRYCCEVQNLVVRHSRHLRK